MDKIRIVGGARLNGTIPISGAKNAALPLMIASLLTDETLTLANLPRLADVALLKRILGNHGVDMTISGKRIGDPELSSETAHFTARTIVDTTAPYDLVSRMRALVLGDRAAARPRGLRQGVSARRLRHRHAPGRSLPGGADGARRLDRDRCRLCHRPRSRRAEGRPRRVPEGHGRRHACDHDGGDARRRRDGDREWPRASRKSSISPNASSRWAPRSAAPAPRPSASRASAGCMARATP